MFAEEVSLLRSQLEFAEKAQEKAETERGRQVEVAAKERSRAQELETILAQAKEEISQLRFQLSDLRGHAASVPTLKAEIDELRSELNATMVMVERRGRAHERTEKLLRERTTQVSQARATITSLSSELDPTRKLVEAIRLWNEASETIRKELGD
jgi:chromosome segregation ATPase